MPTEIGELSMDMGEETTLFSMSFIVFLIILFAVIVLAVIISIRVYQRHLDRVVEGKERDVHTHVVEPRTVLTWIVAGLFVIFMINTMIENAALRTQVENMEQELAQNQRSILYRLQDLEERLDNKDKLADEYDFSFGKINTQEKTVEVLWTVSLKEYTSDTIVSISYGASTCYLSKKGSKFVGTMQAPLFEEYARPLLAVETDDGIKTQELESTFSGVLGEQILSMTEDWNSSYHSEWTTEGNLHVFGVQGVAVKHWFPDADLTGIKLTFRCNDVAVKSIPIPLNNGDEGSVEFDENFAVEGSASFDVWLETELACGWTTSKKVAEYTRSSGLTLNVEPVLNVYGPNGEIIHTGEYEG